MNNVMKLCVGYVWMELCVGYVCIYDETCVLDMLVVYICISVNCYQIK